MITNATLYLDDELLELFHLPTLDDFDEEVKRYYICMKIIDVHFHE